MRSLNFLFVVLALSACGEPADRSAAPAGSSSGPSFAEPTELQAIPAAFQGVWAASDGDCTAPAETRLEITGDHLRFYESSGPVGSVERTGPEEILITVPLTGEGANSLRTFRYRLLDNGSALFDVRSGFTRIRCP